MKKKKLLLKKTKAENMYNPHSVAYTHTNLASRTIFVCSTLNMWRASDIYRRERDWNMRFSAKAIYHRTNATGHNISSPLKHYYRLFLYDCAGVCKFRFKRKPKFIHFCFVIFSLSVLKLYICFFFSKAGLVLAPLRLAPMYCIVFRILLLLLLLLFLLGWTCVSLDDINFRVLYTFF